MIASLLIFSMRAVGMTNDMVFIMWCIIRHDSTLLTWILNLIIQFIRCLSTVVKVSHSIRDHAFGKDYTKDCRECFLLPEGQRSCLGTGQSSNPNFSKLCIHANLRPPVKQELHFLLFGFQWPKVI